MRQAQLGRMRESRGGSGAYVIAAIIALAIVAVLVYYAFGATGTGGGSSPTTAPYQTVAPATGAPATSKPSYP